MTVRFRELSKGQFSDDNQKRLTGLDVEIPIYEAKMTGDTRLVVCHLLWQYAWSG